MSEPLPLKPPDELAALATRIKNGHAAVLDASKNVVQKAITVGTDLIAAKNSADIKYCMWIKWLKDNCGVSERHATRYMQLAAGKQKLASVKSDTMSDLTLTGALRFVQGTGDKKDDGSGDLSKYDKAAAALIKKLKKLSPADIEEAARETIAELEKVVAAVKPAVKQAA
jgi:hypothetical protein